MLATAVAQAIARLDKELVLIGLPDSELIAAGKAAGLGTGAEGFCDRAYEPDGSLRSRTKHGAVFSDPDQAAKQAVALAESGRVQTLCIHGDSPGAAAMALAVRAALDAAGFTIAPLRAHR